MEKQELYCHNCTKYVRFDIDLNVNANYLLVCPECGHQHYRRVVDGVITDERWGQDPSQEVITITATSTSATSYLASATSSTTSATMYLRQAWANSYYQTC